MQAGRGDGTAWLRLSQAAGLLGISLNTLRRWSDTGKVACYRSPGGHRRYRRRDIDALLRRQAGDDRAAEADGRHGLVSSPDSIAPDDVRAALTTLAQVAAEGMGVSVCIVALSDEDGRLRIAAGYGADVEAETIGTVLTRERAPVADEVHHTRRRAVIADLDSTGLFTSAEVAACRTRGDAAVLAVPIAADARYVGVMQLVDRHGPHDFTGSDVGFAEFVAGQAASLVAPAAGTKRSEVHPLVQTVGERRPPASSGDTSPWSTLGGDAWGLLQAFVGLTRHLAPRVSCCVYRVTDGRAIPLAASAGRRPEPFEMEGDGPGAAAGGGATQRLERRDGRCFLFLPLDIVSTRVGLVELGGRDAREVRTAAALVSPAGRLLATILAARGDADALERRTRDLEMVVGAGLEVAGRLGTDEVLHAVCQRLSELTHSPVVDVYAVEGTTLRALVSYDAGRFDPEWEGIVVPVARYPCSLHAIETGDIAIAASLDDEILGPDGRFSLERWGYQSQLSMPLRGGGRVVGLVELSDYVPRDFAGDIDIVRGLGKIAAQALENARLFEQVEHRSRVLNELVALGTFASVCRDFDTVLRHVAERLVRTLDAATCDVYRTCDDGLRCVVSFDRSGFDEEAVGQILDTAVYATVAAGIAAGQPLVVAGPDDPQLGAREREVYREYGFNSEVCVPLLVNDELFGLIDIYDTRTRDFSEHLSFLRSVGMGLAGAFASTIVFEQLEQRTAVLREIAELGALAAETGDLASLLATVAERLRATVGAADCDVLAVEDGQLRCLASFDARGSDDDVVGVTAGLSHYPLSEMVVRTREPVAVASLDDPRLTEAEREACAAWGYESELCVPLVAGDDVVGLIDVFDERPRDYGDYIDFVRSVGQSVAAAMRSAALVDELRTRNLQLSELVGLGRAATSAGRLTALLEIVTSRLCDVVGAAGCQVFGADGSDHRSLYTWEDGAPDESGLGHVLDLDRFPKTRRALESRGALVVSGPDQAGLSPDERRHYTETEWRSGVAVPLVLDERVVGLLEVYDRRERDYGTHMDFLWHAGQIVAGALANAQLLERLEHANVQLGHLVEAGLEFGSTLDAEVVLRSVARRLCAATAARCCDIYRIEGDLLRCLVSVDDDAFDDAFVDTAYRLDDLAGVRDVLAQGRAMAVGDMERDARVSAFERRENLRYGHRAKVELPLVARGETVGLASIFDDHPRDFAELPLLQSLAQVAANALANATLFDELDRSADRMALVGDVSFELSSSLDLSEVLQSTAHRLCAVADTPCCDLYTLDAERRLNCVVSIVDGKTDATWQGRSVPLDSWSAVSAAVDRRMPVVIASPDDALLSQEERARMRERSETAQVVYPLVSKDVVIGVLELLETRGQRTFAEDEIATIAAVCRVAALAIHNAALFDDIKRMHLGNLKALSSALNAKDYYTLGHAARVAAYMVLLGEELGWPPELLQRVEEAAYLHDIGKIGVSDRVLLKPSGLNAKEWELMRQHPAYSADIIRPLFDDDLVAGVRHHHEHFGGGGYPDGLVGEQIPPIARAMCVVDSYDAMSFRRPYRQALSYGACVEELARCSGSQFDPAIVGAFERVLERLRERKAMAVEVAAVAAAKIDPEAHASLRGRGDEDSAAYRTLVRTLRAVRDEHPPARRVTSFTRLGAAAVVVGDAEEDEALRSHIGDERFADEEIGHVFADEPVDRAALFVDQAGVWISGAAPVRDEYGDVAAVTSAALPATTGATEVDGLRSDVTRTFADMVADAAARLGHAEVEAISDGLTGLYNHRYLHERLDEEIERCLRQDGSLALLLLDLDDFRAFNDRYGHSAGDRALREVGRVIDGALRQVDLAARYGGEEFAVILVDADETGAREVADRIRHGIAEAETTLGRGSLSVSIGMALCPADASHKEELIDKADWAMYVAKRRGRGQVVSFGAEHGALTPEQVASVHDDHVTALAALVGVRDAYLKQRRDAVTDLALATARELGLERESMRDVISAAAAVCDDAAAADLDDREAPLPRQIAALAATYESLVTGRPYRPHISEAEALDELHSCPALRYEPRLAAAMEAVLTRRRT